MSKSANTELEETDENVLFDDGFAVVDDINAGAGSVEGDDKTDGKKTDDQADPDVNSEGTVSDERKEIVSNKKEDAEVENVESKKPIENEIKKDTPDKKAEAKKEPSKSCGDGSTLILSNDEDLGSETQVANQIKFKIEQVTVESKEKVSSPKETKIPSSTKETEANSTNKRPPIRKKGTPPSFVWVTNISNSVNASSLKKHFSECGRVNTAKVVTNGKLFFGYVEFDSPKIAQECVEKMNNTVLGAKKILVSRSRPDVTKKSSNVQRKSLKDDQATKRSDFQKKNEVDVAADKKELEKSCDKVKKDVNEKKTNEDKNKAGEVDKTKKPEDKPTDKKSKSIKEDTQVKGDELKKRMNETRRKLEGLRTDLERTQVEVRNLRRRLTVEQKKSKTEELRAERYRQQMRKLAEEIKEAKLEFKKDIHRLTKKHKLEMEKAEFDRDSFLKRDDDLRRRQEELNREFKKLEETKKSMEHLKRSRKSRSMSPPLKRYRGRDAAYPDVSPPPPPKLSGDNRKPLLDRPPTYYDIVFIFLIYTSSFSSS